MEFSLLQVNILESIRRRARIASQGLWARQGKAQTYDAGTAQEQEVRPSLSKWRLFVRGLQAPGPTASSHSAMSPRPTIFISAVSKELRSARQLVANTLTFLGYEPVWQDIFGTEGGDLRQMLRQQIDQCKGVVQLVEIGRASCRERV